METDIVFVNPPLSSEEKMGDLAEGSSNAPPLGLCYLAAMTRKEGYNTKIVDAEALQLNLIKTADKILKLNPKYIGLTATTISIYNAANLAVILKKHNKDLKIIIGGAHITAVPEETMQKFDCFDVGILAEGELTIVNLLNALKKNKNLKGVKGIIFRKNNKLVKTEPADFIIKLDDLPYPAWNLLPKLTKYYRPALFSFQRLPSTTLVTSRGCPNKCTFCDRAVFGNIFRMHSTDYIMGMIKHLMKRYGIRDILFQDDTFTLHRRRLIEICNRIIKEKIDLTWSCNSRINTVDYKLLKLMKKAGCYSIAYGIESGSSKIIKILQKDIDLNLAKKIIDDTERAGIRTRGYFMVGNPGDTDKTIRESIAYSKKLNLSYIHVQALTPFPGCEIHDNWQKYGYLDDDWRKMNERNIIFVPHGLTKKKLNQYMKEFYWGFYFRPKVILKHLRYVFEPSFLLKVTKGLKVMLKLKRSKT